MNEVNFLKEQAKEYLDNADERVIKMVHAMLEVNAENDWWNDLSDDVKNEINESIKELDEGKGISHEDVKKCIRNGFQNSMVAIRPSKLYR
ncbi:MAG: hypothetical protein M3015_15720 [Bacteroidota bacterium]|nr:hypothetical protein [Bacteroidota bacterium]